MPRDPAPASAVTASALGKGVLLALSGILFMSISGMLVRLTEAATSWQIVLYRSLALAATLLVVLAIRYRLDLLRPFRAGGSDAVLAALCFSASSTLYILALAHVTVANALFMAGIAPFIAALGARAWLGEAIRRETWGGMVLAGAGVAIMLGSALAFEGILGNALALFASVAMALFGICLRRRPQADMTATALWSGILSTVLAALVLALAGPAGAPFAVTKLDLALCLFMGAVQLGLGLTLYTMAARHLAAGPLQLIGLSELVFSPIWVWLAVGEVPGAATIAGGALILAAVALQASAAWSARAGRSGEAG